MLWFAFVYIVIGLLSPTDLSARKRRWPMVVAWLLLSMTAGFRNSGGTDYEVYLNHYYEDDVFSYYFEYGYSACVWLARSLGLSYNVFLAVLSAGTIGFMCRFFRKYSTYPMLSIVLYAGLYFLFFNMVLTRQMVAVVACLYAIGYMMDGKFWKFILAVCIGALFHYSILILIPGYLFIRYFKLNALSIGLLAVATLFLASLGFENAINLLDSSGLSLLEDRSEKYIEVQAGINPIEFVKVAVMLPLILIFRKYIREADPRDALIKCYLIFVCLLVAFSNNEVMVRVAMYFDLSTVLLVPIVVRSMNYKSRGMIFFIIAALSLFSILYRANNFGQDFETYTFFFLEQ